MVVFWSKLTLWCIIFDHFLHKRLSQTCQVMHGQKPKGLQSHFQALGLKLRKKNCQGTATLQVFIPLDHWLLWDNTVGNHSVSSLPLLVFETEFIMFSHWKAVVPVFLIIGAKKAKDREQWYFLRESRATRKQIYLFYHLGHGDTVRISFFPFLSCPFSVLPSPQFLVSPKVCLLWLFQGPSLTKLLESPLGECSLVSSLRGHRPTWDFRAFHAIKVSFSHIFQELDSKSDHKINLNLCFKTAQNPP